MVGACEIGDERSVQRAGGIGLGAVLLSCVAWELTTAFESSVIDARP
jgi:hypothetical protein